MAKVTELPDSPEGPHGLTARQLKILGAIKDALENNGYPPSMREIGVVAGLTSPASVKYQLEALEKKGFIRRDPTRGRALEVVGSGDLFMLKVVGESMINAAICDGDYVVIRSQKDCNNGEIVAAMIDGEATVKTFSRKNGHIWLLPANDDFAPIDGDNCEILGKVTAVLRSVR
jgi:repressor LexA